MTTRREHIQAIRTRLRTMLDRRQLGGGYNGMKSEQVIDFVTTILKWCDRADTTPVNQRDAYWGRCAEWMARALENLEAWLDGREVPWPEPYDTGSPDGP